MENTPLPTLATLRAESAIVQTKDALFKRFDRCETIEKRLSTVYLFREFLEDVAQRYPVQACAWARELWRRIFHLYSDSDELYFDRGHGLARLFGLCLEINENLEDSFNRLAA